VTDETTKQGVGNGGCNGGGSPNVVSGSFYSGVVIAAGDTLQVGMGGVYNPPYSGTTYTVNVSTTSDTLPAASENFTVSAESAVTNASVSLNGVSDATNARSGYQISFTTSATGGMSAADGSSWTISFPAGSANFCNLTYLQVTDVTTNQGVGNGGCAGGGSPNIISGSFYSGVTIAAGDTLQVDLGGAYNPPHSGSYGVQVQTSSDTAPASSINEFTAGAGASVSNVSVSLATGSDASTAAGARAGYTVTLTTSATTGGLSSADGSSWSISFPTGTNLCNLTYLSVVDLTTNAGVGGGGCAGGGSPNVISGGFYSNVAIAAGDTLQVSIGGAYNPPYPGTYSVQASTSSDTTPVTSFDDFTVTAAGSVTNVGVALDGVSTAANARSGYSVSFTTSATTGGLSSADGSSWTIVFPSGTNLCNLTYLQVTDVTTGQGVGGGGCAGGGNPSTISGGFYSNVVIAPGDELQVNFGGAYNPPYPGSYSVQVWTSSDTTSVDSPSFAVAAGNALTSASVALAGASAVAGARSGYSVSFVTSATGGLSSADGSSWTVSFPAGTNLCSLTYLQVTDVTTNQGVGGGGCAGGGAPNVISGGFNSNVDIHAGDTLRVDIGGAYNVSAPGAYSVVVSTSSDPPGTTSSDKYTVVGPQAVSNAQVTLDNAGAGTAGVNYTVTFTTSSSGALYSADGSSWSITFPPGSNFCGLHYLSVTDLTTGQGVGGGGCAGGGNANVISGGFNSAVVIHAGDTLRVSAGGATNPPGVGQQNVSVSTSSDTVPATATYQTTATTTASGTVVDANNNPVVGSSVQACPSAGGPCQVATSQSGGAFSVFGLQAGTYTVIAYPPAGAPGTQSAADPITVNFPNPVTGIQLQLASTTVMPAGATLTSGGGTTGGGTVPTVNWGNPITYSVSGCKGGFGLLRISAVNTSTGQPETQFYPLAEAPPGSGTYTAQIPPLAPLHGSGSVAETITCPGHTEVLPALGSPQGGTTVLLTGSGFTGATAVQFGTAPGTKVQVLGDTAILVVSPAGTGTVAVSVTTPAGAVSVGNFTYMGVSSISTTSGPSSGGTTVTINGQGLAGAVGVAFGNAYIPRSKFESITDTAITVAAPPQFGSDSPTVPVQVIGSFGVSQPTASAQYSYTGPPPPMTNGEMCAAQPDLPVCQLANWLNISGVLAGGVFAVLAAPDAAAILGAAKSAVLDTLLDGLIAVTDDGILADLGIGALAAIEGTALLPLAGVILAGIALGVFIWSLLIDPSGTVLDTYGNPVTAAKTTILQESSTGSFSAVPALSGEIQPAVNPETTTKSGEFHWDAVAGTYEVEAAATGCHAPGNPSQPAADTAPFQLPPPAVGLVVTLDCSSRTAPTPVVTGLNPATGPTSGGTLVQITGSGLGAATAVHFGAVEATGVTVLSPYAITAVAPAGSSTVDVTVTTPGGTSAITPAGKYAFTNPPTKQNAPSIASVAPAHGPISGGTKVQITGANLSEIVGAQFGTTAAAGVVNVSSSEVIVTAPPALVAGPADITLTSTNGVSAISGHDVFVYDEPPGTTPPPTTIALSSSSNPSQAGRQLTFVANVGPTDGGGSVTFFADGAKTPITGCLAVPLTLVGNRFQSSCSTPTLTPGMHKITAAYSGDQGSSSASGNLSQTVERALSTTSLSLSAGGLVYGREQVETLTVGVAPASPHVATGSVVIKSGRTIVCTAKLANSRGTCSPTPISLGAGSFKLVADYSGDSYFNTSVSSGHYLLVLKAKSAPSLALSALRITYGQEQKERFSVTVKAQYSGVPLGTVTISSGKTLLCRISLSNGRGACSPFPKALSSGTQKIVATYGGSTDFNGAVSSTKLLTVVA
jgi:hypothetical protein